MDDLDVGFGVFGEDALGDGEVAAFVVGDEVGFLEEGAAEGVFGVIVAAFERKVAACAIDEGWAGSAVESGVREDDGDGGTAVDGVAEGECDGRVAGQKAIVLGVTNEVELASVVPG